MRLAIAIGHWNDKWRHVINLYGRVEYVRGRIGDRVANEDAVPQEQVVRLPRNMTVNRFTKKLERTAH